MYKLGLGSGVWGLGKIKLLNDDNNQLFLIHSPL
jgi:hypothetical protein